MTIHGIVLQQNLLRITTIEEAPYVIKKVLPNGKVGFLQPLYHLFQFVYEGFCIDLISRLAFSLRFQYQINIVKDGRYGEKLSEHNDWDGMVGEILRGVSDKIKWREMFRKRTWP